MDNQYLYTIDSLELSIVEDYIGNNDVIFNNMTNGMSDNGYSRHVNDYTRSVFVNTVINDGVCYLDKRGFVTVPEVKLDIFTTEIGKRLFTLDRTNKDHLTTGIYIVEEWNIRAFTGGSASSNDRLERYYKYIEQFVKISDKEMVNLKRIVNKMTDRHIRKEVLNDVSIRTITFIPIKDLMEKKMIFDTHTDLVFMLGGPDTTITHPSSITHAERLKKVNTYDIRSNKINIEIIDNDKEARPYFTKIGNEVVRLKSIKDNTTGSKINVTKDGNLLSECRTFDSEKLGIYTSELDAINNGDHKLAVERTKYEVDMSKLEHEKFKMSKELESLTMKYEHELHVMDMKLSLAKLDYKKAMKNYVYDIKSKIMEFNFKQVYHMNDVMESAVKLKADLKVLNVKLANEITKENNKRVTSIMDSVIKNIPVLLKLL